MKIYLHQFLSKTGAFPSKKDALLAIQRGLVCVDGRAVSDPAFQFNTAKKVTYEGKALSLESRVCLILNKPRGYLSSKLSATDLRLGKKSVFDLIRLPEKKKNALFCVGRLDEDTSGLIILTNDGKLGSLLTNPKHGITKTYEAVLEKPLAEEERRKVETGMTIVLEESGKMTRYRTKPCMVAVGKDLRHVIIILSEGKKREVRRIFEAVGNTVLSLERSAIGKLELAKLSLKTGEYRLVKKEEIESLF